MVERRRLSEEDLAPVASPPPKAGGEDFLTSGSFLLDKMLGGGWPFGRVVNIVGDSSSGKTLLAIEALINCCRLFSPKSCRYAEAEAAFDDANGEVLGFPPEIDIYQDARTIQEFDADLRNFLSKQKGPSLYVLDSLDALSDTEEMKRDLGDATYGTAKSKLLSEMFRKVVKDIESKKTCLIIVSQVREAIGVMFGEKYTRSGGKALRFYASQEVWLAVTGKIKRTVSRVDRIVGVDIRARTKKNKVGLPFRECNLQIIFGYGVDDEASMIDWLRETNTWDKPSAESIERELMSMRKAKDRGGLAEFRAEICGVVGTRWDEIENSLRPPMRKYE